MIGVTHHPNPYTTLPTSQRSATLKIDHYQDTARPLADQSCLGLSLPGSLPLHHLYLLAACATVQRVENFDGTSAQLNR